MKLWQENAECEFEGFETAPQVNEIVTLAANMGLEVYNSDIEELVEEHSQELTIKELMELQWHTLPCETDRICS